MRCLPARAARAQLELEVNEYHGANAGVTPAAARAAVATLFGHASWKTLSKELERREVLDSCDLPRAQALIERDPAWATTPLTGWCDHRRGAAPLSYMAMLRFDSARLGLTGDLSQTGAMAQLLLDAGAPVNGNPGDRETPLMTAASYGDADVARVLIDAGAKLDALASPDAGGVPGGSALRHAAVFGMTDVLNALVQAGARVRSLAEAAAAGDLDGWLTGEETPDERIRALIMAADHERLEVIDQLLAAGTPIDVTDPRWHRQALRLAARNGRVASVRHLLARGADPTATDAQGRTALDLCPPEHPEVAAILAPLTPEP